MNPSANRPTLSRNVSGGGTPPRNPPAPSSIDYNKINLDNIDANLFDKTAQEVAEILANTEKTSSNKPTQIRRFYDEICMWDERVEMNPDNFNNLLPFIRMINAKTAYAKGRNTLVDDNFVNLIRHCLQKVDNPKSMKNFKLFMEAMMGFYKEKRPKDS